MFFALQSRVDSIKEELIQSAGIDATNDRFKAGYAQACLDFINTDYEEVKSDSA